MKMMGEIVNTRNLRAACLPPIALALALCASPALAIHEAQSADGVQFISGGVGHKEQMSLNGTRDKYSFWLTTAALGSGAFLADAHVRITEKPSGKLVLEDTMDGPWLYAALRPGRYDVTATYRAQGATKDETIVRTTIVEDTELRQMVFYFESPAEVGPENKSAFVESPYIQKR